MRVGLPGFDVPGRLLRETKVRSGMAVRVFRECGLQGQEVPSPPSSYSMAPRSTACPW